MTEGRMSHDDRAVLDLFYGILVKFFPRFQRKILLRAIKMQEQYEDAIRMFLRRTYEIPGSAPSILARTFLEIAVGADPARLRNDYPEVFNGIIDPDDLLDPDSIPGPVELVAIPKCNMGPAKKIPFGEAIEYYTAPDMGFRSAPFCAPFQVFQSLREGNGKKMKKYAGKRLYFSSTAEIFSTDQVGCTLCVRVGPDGMMSSPELVELDGLVLDAESVLVLSKPWMPPLENGAKISG
ncbi:MAG: hypothetical protein HGA16_00635 [Candidatus Moranbacteria bacterium]|nr:hypothetical protein [Candidatus Moranbacteria bacterium]